MAKKKNSVDLPEWAQTLWEEMGSPDLESNVGIHNGNLLERRHGLRRDDLIEILMDARALAEGNDGWIKGRLLSSGKSSLEILAEDGKNHYISRDVIVQVILVAHTRPPYIDDSELLAFERDDMKRRSSLHEKVEKQKSGNDDAHLWG